LTFLTMITIWCSLKHFCMIAFNCVLPAADLQLSMANKL